MFKRFESVEHQSHKTSPYLVVLVIFLGCLFNVDVVHAVEQILKKSTLNAKKTFRGRTFDERGPMSLCLVSDIKVFHS